MAWGSFAQKPLTPAKPKYEKVALFQASYLKWVWKQNRKLSSFKTKERYTAKQEFHFIPSHKVFIVDVLDKIKFLTDWEECSKFYTERRKTKREIRNVEIPVLIGGAGRGNRSQQRRKQKA